MALGLADTQNDGLIRQSFVRTRAIPRPSAPTTRAIPRPYHLPAVMREGFVRLRHAVNVVLPLPGAALLLIRVEDLSGETLSHRVLATGPGELDEPTDRQGAGAAGGDLDRHLVGGATDAAGADLEHRGQLFDRCLQGLDRVLAAALADDRQGVVDDPLGKALLAVAHDLVDQL